MEYKHLPEGVLPPITFHDLIHSDWPEEEFISGGFFMRGDRMVIGAESKAGKTTLLSYLIRQLITGGDFLGFKINRPMRVLNLQAEMRNPQMKKRMYPKFSKLSEEHLLNSYTFYTRGMMLLDDPDHQKAFLELFEQVKPDLAILDPFINFHSQDENDSRSMMRVFRFIDRLKEKYNFSVAIAQHFRKKGQNDHSLLEMIRGTTALRGWADTIIAMEGRTESGYRRLEFETRNVDEPINRIIKYNPDTKEFDWMDPTAKATELIISAWGEGDEKTGKEVDIFIKETCGHLFGSNRAKILSFKKHLLGTNILDHRKDGRKVLYFLK